MELRQYQIVIVNLDPTIGSEIRKTRPCIIVSPNEMNEYFRTTIIVPITSNKKNYPTRLKVKVNQREGRAAIDQIRTIDKRRIVKVIGELSTKESLKLKKLISQMLVD